MTDVRLRAVTPNGSALGPLPAPESLSASYVLNDTGALSFSYPLDAPLSSLLGQALEVVTEVSTDDGTTWAEPPNGRFLYLNDGRDPIKADAFSADCPGYIIRLTKGLIPFTSLDGNGQRVFAAATPGKILNDLFSEAQTRGALTGITWTFTAVNDSSGTAWPVGTQQTIGYQPGQNFLEVLQGLADAGLVDYRTNGREIQVYIADVTTGMAVDRSIGSNPVTLRPGQGLVEAPFRRTWAGLADTAYVQGDGTSTLIRTNAGAVKPWGRQETFVSAAGVKDAGTLTTVADGALSSTDDVRIERTFGLTFASAAFHPFAHYGVGEYVFQVSDGLVAAERNRVRQITLTRDGDGQSAGNAVLNDRFLEADIRQARNLSKLTSGATQGGSGSSPIGNDILPPAGVGVVTTGSTAYLDIHGDVKATITLDWPDVTTNSDGTTLTDLDHYDVHRRRSGDVTWTKVDEVNASNWSDSPYEPNETWEFRVCAVDSVYNRGAFSATVAKTTASDVTGPVAPSQPSGSSSPANAAAIVIGWDGKNNVGAAMDPDLDYVEVHVSTTNGFTATGGSTTTVKATLDPGPGSVTIAGLVEGTTYYVVLKPRDTSGNYGAQSVQRVVVASRRTDGAVPSSLPANTALLQFAVGGLEARWDAVTNADPVTYDVYLAQGAPVAVFNSTTLLGSTDATRFGISRKVDGSALVADTDYYIAVKVRDGDGTTAGQSTAGPTQYRKADAQTISALWAYLGNVQANQIRSGSLDADLVLAKSITAGDGVTQRKVSLSADGLLVTDAGGSPVVSIPTSLSSDVTINANILAKTLTADGLAQFNDVTIVRGKNITLQKGTQPPSAPVIPANSYPVVPFPTTPAQSFPGLSYSIAMGTAFFDDVAGNIITSWTESTGADSSQDTIETRNRTTGALLSTLFTVSSSHGGGCRGIAKIGSFLYLARMDGYDTFGEDAYWIEKYSTAGVLQSRWQLPSGMHFSRIGLDGSNLLLVWTGSGVLKFGTYNPDTGVIVGSVTTTSITTALVGSPVSVTKRTTDLPVGAAASRIIVQTDKLNVVMTAAGARETNSEWPLDDSGNTGAGATVWDSAASQWKHVYSDLGAGANPAYIKSHTGDLWAGATTRAVKATATYYDNNATGGVHETIQGPIASLNHNKRAWITASIDSLPAPSVPPTTDDANSWNLYLGTSTGVRTTQWRVGTLGGTALAQTVQNVLTSGTNPPAAGNFTNQTAARVQSADAVYYFDGLGDAKIDDLVTNTLTASAAVNLGDLQTLPHLELTQPLRQTVADAQLANNTATLMRWTTTTQADGTATITNPNTALNADGRIVFTKAGVYRITAQFTFASSTAGTTRRMNLYLNGTTTVLGADSRIANGVQGTTVEVTIERRFAAADYMLTEVLQASGGVLGVFATQEGYQHLQITRICA